MHVFEEIAQSEKTSRRETDPHRWFYFAAQSRPISVDLGAHFKLIMRAPQSAHNSLVPLRPALLLRLFFGTMGIHSPAAAGAALLSLLLLPPHLLAVDLDKIQRITLSSASDDFAGGEPAYAAARNWHTEPLLRDGGEGFRAPYIACADYSDGHRALASLETAFSKSATHRVSNNEADGSCFIVTASPTAGTALSQSPEMFSLVSAAPFLPSLKLATGMVDHGLDTPPHLRNADAEAANRSARLRSTYGEAVSLEHVRGLSVRLSPGVLPAGGSLAPAFVRDWHADLMSEGVTLETMSFWSDPGADRRLQDKTRVREWSRAATVVDGMASEYGRPAGEICKLGGLRMHHVGDDLLLVEGEKLRRQKPAMR